jgi:HMG (high mobility group) box
MYTRAVSPFIVFCNSRRAELKAANPGANYGEIAMVLSLLWKSMSQSEKDAYAQPRKAPESVPVPAQTEPELRRSSRLRNKNLGLNFWGLKIKK